MNLKNQIEALLFLTDKPLKTQVIARTINQDVQLVRQAMLELINDYEERQGAIEIADEDGYMMQVKDEFSNLVDEFAPFEMPTSLVRTLSAIAIKQPVMQSEVIKIRGAGAYDHIKELLARELIHRKEDGRSPTLTTTKKFQEYFRLSKDGQTWRTVMDKAQKAAPADHIDMDDEVIESPSNWLFLMLRQSKRVLLTPALSLIKQMSRTVSPMNQSACLKLSMP
ncbi:MAG: SMC-Scp complex subunit ScpB [Candidatus Obscuribacter sp.]|nr:SMC-Scp complex subunit ScpB [Candidatus Obscuribacter sp.]